MSNKMHITLILNSYPLDTTFFFKVLEVVHFFFYSLDEFLVIV